MAQVRNTYSNTGLNALRGIGITGIVLYHLFPSVFCGGFMGVPLFFVLSGYLMYTTSEKRAKGELFMLLIIIKDEYTKYCRRFFQWLCASAAISP